MTIHEKVELRLSPLPSFLSGRWHVIRSSHEDLSSSALFWTLKEDGVLLIEQNGKPNIIKRYLFYSHTPIGVEFADTAGSIYGVVVIDGEMYDLMSIHNTQIRLYDLSKVKCLPEDYLFYYTLERQ